MPGGRIGNSAANPSSMPCTRLSPSAPDFFFGPTSPSASSSVRPCTRDQHARIAPAIFRSLRAVSGIARPSPPATITLASSSFGLLGFGQLDGGAAMIRAAQIASEHQAVERRIFDAVIDVSAQHREQLLASTAEARNCTGHPLRQHLEPRRRDGSQKLTLVGKVLVRRIVTDAGAPGEFAQRKLKALRLAQDFERGLDDRAAQVAVVVGTLGGVRLGHWSKIAVDLRISTP